MGTWVTWLGLESTRVTKIMTCCLTSPTPPKTRTWIGLEHQWLETWLDLRYFTGKTWNNPASQTNKNMKIYYDLRAAQCLLISDDVMWRSKPRLPTAARRVVSYDGKFCLSYKLVSYPSAFLTAVRSPQQHSVCFVSPNTRVVPNAPSLPRIWMSARLFFNAVVGP